MAEMMMREYPIAVKGFAESYFARRAVEGLCALTYVEKQACIEALQDFPLEAGEIRDLFLTCGLLEVLAGSLVDPDAGVRASAALVMKRLCIMHADFDVDAWLSRVVMGGGSEEVSEGLLRWLVCEGRPT